MLRSIQGRAENNLIDQLWPRDCVAEIDFYVMDIHVTL